MKNTTGGCFYQGENMISWHNKKQNSVSLSSTEAKYIAIGSACTQLNWMTKMLNDYGIKTKECRLFCDNKGAIDLSKNPVSDSEAKHIAIRHHFIRDLVEYGYHDLHHVSTNAHLADIFTKPLDAEKFESQRASLGLYMIWISCDWLYVFFFFVFLFLFFLFIFLLRWTDFFSEYPTLWSYWLVFVYVLENAGAVHDTEFLMVLMGKLILLMLLLSLIFL